MLVWKNPQSVYLVSAPLAHCQSNDLASSVGADGVQRFVVGTAAALNVEAAETLRCS